MIPLLRNWLPLLVLGLSACASGAGSSSDACAPLADMLGRQMAASGVALPSEAPRRPELVAALRLANLHLQLAQDAASRLFECRAAEARLVREEQAAGRIWGVTAELRIARIRYALRQETEAALEVSERIAAADAALVAAAVQPDVELRRLVATNVARREGFGTMVLLAGRFTDSEMDREVSSRSGASR